MKRVIVDYAKLTNEILTLLVERFPEGYDDSNIIRFKNAKNETIEAVEVRTEDTIYLVKVSTKLADRIENFDEDDIDPTEEIDGLKDLDIADDADDDDDVEEKVDSPDNEDDGEDGDNRDIEDTEYSEDDEDED
ncbi:DNA primase [Flavobacterium cerinum]|uniref:DNA primase n=1 Tax=Flavobacterium cerinum TaxID=2502784 RepID=A0A444H042_9FLAO|nr:DNA primase [Flavobacterium cerinum]RWW96621.1 DNA primase [Flavobacterium cerinum]